MSTMWKLEVCIDTLQTIAEGKEKDFGYTHPERKMIELAIETLKAIGVLEEDNEE